MQIQLKLYQRFGESVSHEQALLGKLPVKQSAIVDLQTSIDNSVVAIYSDHYDSKYSKHRYRVFYQGLELRIKTRPLNKPHTELQIHLNYSGDRLAICHRCNPSDKHHYAISVYQIGSIDPIETYYCDFDTLYSVAWIDNRQLAWYGWNRQELQRRARQGQVEKTEEETEKHFINGKPAPKGFEFETYWEGVQFIWPCGKSITKMPNGEAVERQVDPENWRYGPRNDPETQEELDKYGVAGPYIQSRFRKGKNYNRVAYKDYRGPWVTGNLSNTGPDTGFTLSTDRQQLAYTQEYVRPLLRPFYDFAQSLSCMAWLVLFPLIPIYMLLLFLLQPVARAQVVQVFLGTKHELYWKPTHRVNKLFFAGNNLIAVQTGFGHDSVWINNRPGPKFKKIYNARGLKDGSVNYLGLHNDHFYRVST